MGSFFRRGKNKKSGWLASGFQPDGVCAAYARRVTDRKPVIEWLSFYPAAREARPKVLARLEKEHGTSGSQRSNLLSFTDYQMLSLEAPAVPAVELKQAVRWRLKDMLDYHIDDATIDVLSVPADRSMAARSSTMFAVAARSQLIGQLHDLFDKAGMAVRVIDIPDMAQRNISALVEPNGRAIAMLSVNVDGALVTLTSGGELYFSRRIDVTAAQLKQSDHDATLACYDKISLELQRSLDHFDRQFHYLQMSKLVLAPMGDGAEALKAYLAENLHIPVEVLDLESVLDLSRIPELKNRANQQRHFMVIGAALRLEEAAL